MTGGSNDVKVLRSLLLGPPHLRGLRHAPVAEKRGLSPPFLATQREALGAGAGFGGESDGHPADALDDEIGGEE